jgi:integrase
MGSPKIPFTPAQVRKALLEAQAQGVDIAEIRSHPDGSLSFVAKLSDHQPLEATDAATRAKAKSIREELELPKGIRFQPKTLKDGSVVRYGYYGVGKEAVSLGRLGTPAFDKAVKHLVRSDRQAPEEGTVANLVYRYKASADFARLREATKRDYRRWLDEVQETFGRRSLEEVEARAFSAEIFAWRDKRAYSPRQADYGVQVFKMLLSWACRRGLIDINRAAHVDKLYRLNRRANSWSEAQIEAFLAAASPNLQLALMLALETGQRQGDVVRLEWSDIQDGVLHLKQSKTGAIVAVPISPVLQAHLDAAPGEHRGPILRSETGRLWGNPGCALRSAWQNVCKRAGIQGVTFHDLRGTFVTRRLSEGWTPTEVAMCTGHTLRDLASLDVYADRKVIARRTAERLAGRRFSA